MARHKIGEVLVEMGFLDEGQLKSALAHQRQWGTPLARAVVERRFCTLAQTMQALSRQTGLPLADLAHETLDPKMAAVVPVKVAEQHHLVPLRLEGAKGELLVVAIAAPASLGSLDAVRAVSRKSQVRALLADDEAIERALGVIYRGEQPSVPQSFHAATIDAREQEYNGGAAPSAPNPPVADPLPGIAGLSLTPECVRVIRRAAEHHGITERAVIERVIEAWTSRQRGT